jgi:hypothetical protein
MSIFKAYVVHLQSHGGAKFLKINIVIGCFEHVWTQRQLNEKV